MDLPTSSSTLQASSSDSASHLNLNKSSPSLFDRVLGFVGIQPMPFVSEGASSSLMKESTSSDNLSNIMPIQEKILRFAQKVDMAHPEKFVDELSQIAQPYQPSTQFKLNTLRTKVIDLGENNNHNTLLQWAGNAFLGRNNYAHMKLLLWAMQTFPNKTDPRYQFISQKTYETKINVALSTKLQNAVAFLSNESPRAQKSFIADFAAGVAGFGGQCGAEADTRIIESFERLEYGLTEGLSTQNTGSKGNVGELHAKISVLTLKHEMQRFHHWFDQAYPASETTERTGPYRQHRDTYLETGSTTLSGQPILEFDLNALVKSLHKSITAFHAPQDIIALRKNITQQFPQLVYSNPNEPSGEVGDFIAYNQSEAFIMNDQLLPSLLADAGIIQLAENGRLQLEPMALAFETFSKAIQQLDLPSDASHEIKEIMSLQQAKIEQIIREIVPLLESTQVYEQYQTQELAQTIPTRTDLHGVRLFRQQALDIFLPNRNRGERVDLSDIDLSDIDPRGANFRGVRLSREQILDIIHLARSLGERPNLCGTNLRGESLHGVDIDNVDLNGAIVSRQQLKSVRSMKGASLGLINRLKAI